MPYSKAEFDAAKQDAYKAALANAAGTVAANVDILSITDARRRAGSVAVLTKIRATDASSAAALSSTLGTGAALKAKLDASLGAQGLAASSAVSAPVVTATDTPATPATPAPAPPAAPVVAAGVFGRDVQRWLDKQLERVVPSEHYPPLPECSSAAATGERLKAMLRGRPPAVTHSLRCV